MEINFNLKHQQVKALRNLFYLVVLVNHIENSPSIWSMSYYFIGNLLYIVARGVPCGHSHQFSRLDVQLQCFDVSFNSKRLQHLCNF